MPSTGTSRVYVDEGAIRVFSASPNGPVTRMLTQATQVVLQGAKRRCPTSPHGSAGAPSGHLRSSLKGEVVGRGGGLTGRVYTDVPYALFVEVGTKAHDIYPKKAGGMLRWMGKGGPVYAKHVHHPGTRAQSYLRAALDDLAGKSFR